MFAKGPSTSHNYLKLITRETLLKTFSMSICITTQLRCRSKKVRMSKGWPHNLQGLTLQIDGGIGAFEMAPEVVGQWNN
jgi:hypothetical protein